MLFNPNNWSANPTAPTGKCWKCPDCDSWATLPENAGFHMETEGHHTPTLEDQPPLPPSLRSKGLDAFACRECGSTCSSTEEPPKDGTRVLVQRVLTGYSSSHQEYRETGTQWIEAWWDANSRHYPDGIWREWLGSKRTTSTGDGFKIIDWRPLP